MSAPAAWTCPACKEPLQKAHPSHGVFACEACGGVWANNAALEALRAPGDGGIVSLSKRISGDAPEETRAEVISANESGRKCPVCWHRLVRSTIGDIAAVDSCAKHGTWFDRDEIEAIYAAAPKPRASGSGSSTAGDIAMGVIEIFGAILSGL